MTSPANIIKRAPGNNWPNGFSEKKTHPRKIDDGMPIYSKGAKILGEEDL